MSNGLIKKEKEIIDGRMYYKVMLKKDRFFAFWFEAFGSFNKEKSDNMFKEISKADNITIKGR